MDKKIINSENYGWISLHRKLSDSKFWTSEPFSRPQAWVDLLMIANHSDGFIRVAGERIKIERGQCGWSQLRLAGRWRWSRGKVKRFLEELEKTEQQIEQQKNSRTTIITIKNYNLYQQQKEHQTNIRRTSDGHQTDTNNKNNNGNNENNNNVFKNLEKFFRGFVPPAIAISKASFYWGKNPRESIKKALDNTSCISEAGFIECLKYYNKRKKDNDMPK